MSNRVHPTRRGLSPQVKLPDGSWLPAIPRPYVHLGGLLFRCHCGHRFSRLRSYRRHYVVRHVYGPVIER